MSQALYFFGGSADGKTYMVPDGHNEFHMPCEPGQKCERYIRVRARREMPFLSPPFTEGEHAMVLDYTFAPSDSWEAVK